MNWDVLGGIGVDLGVNQGVLGEFRWIGGNWIELGSIGLNFVELG